MSAILNSKAAMDVAVLVDQYRHQHVAAEQVLEQFASRGEMERALVAFYQRQGISDVTPEMVKAGIEAYERDRLTFKGVQGNALTRKLVNLYVRFSEHRVNNMKLVGLACCGLILFALTFIGVFASLNAMHDNMMVTQAEKHQDNTQNMISKAQALIDRSPQTIVGSEYGAMEHAQSQALDLRDQTQSYVDQLAVALSQLVALSDEYSSASATEKNELNNDLQNLLDDVSEKSDKAQQSIAELANLVEADLQYQRLIGSDQYQKHKSYPEVIHHRAQALISMNTSEGVTALKSVRAMQTAFINHESSQMLATSLTELTGEFKADFKDDDGLILFNSLVDDASDAARANNKDEFYRKLNDIRLLHGYVMSNLTVRIADRSGMFSVVERSNGNAMRHYLILEMLNAQGQQVKREILNRETNSRTKVMHWGEQVDKSKYDQVYADKSADGIVDDYAMGRKPSGYYNIDYSTPVIGAQITSW